MIDFEALLSSPEYQQLGDVEKHKVKSSFLYDLSQTPDFKSLAIPEREKVVHQTLFGDEIPKENNLAIKAIPQFTKALYEGTPFGKRAVSMLPNSEEIQQTMENTPAPQGIKANIGKFVGEIATASPAIAGSEAIIPSKLAAGALGFGAQRAGQASSEGAKPASALGQGALTAGTVYAGGKVIGKAIEGITKIPAAEKWMSQRIYNSLIAPLKKDFAYAKNPGRGLSETKLYFNNWEEAPKKVQQELTSRVADLEQNVAGRTELINPEQNITRVFEKAKSDAIRQNNQALLTGINKVEQAVKNNLITDAEGNIISGTPKKLSNINLSEALKLKRDIGEVTTWTGNPTDLKPLNNLKQNLYRVVKNDMNKVAPELAQKNEVIADLIGAKNAIKHRAAIEMRQSLLGMPSRIATAISGVGYVATHNPATVIPAIGMIGLEKALKSPFIMTRLAGTLSRMSETDVRVVMKAYPALAEGLNRFAQYIKQVPENVRNSIFKDYPELQNKFGSAGVMDTLKSNQIQSGIQNEALRGNLTKQISKFKYETNKGFQKEPNWSRTPEGKWFNNPNEEQKGKAFLQELWEDLKSEQGFARISKKSQVEKQIEEFQKFAEQSRANSDDGRAQYYLDKVADLKAGFKSEPIKIHKEEADMEKLGQELNQTTVKSPQYYLKMNEREVLEAFQQQFPQEQWEAFTLDEMRAALISEIGKSNKPQKFSWNNEKGFAKTSNEFNTPKIPLPKSGETFDAEGYWISSNGKLIKNEFSHPGDAIKNWSKLGIKDTLENVLKKGGVSKEYIDMIKSGKLKPGDLEIDDTGTGIPQAINSAVMKAGGIRTAIMGDGELSLQFYKVDSNTVNKITQVIENHPNFTRFTVEEDAGKYFEDGNAKQVINSLKSQLQGGKKPSDASKWHNAVGQVAKSPLRIVAGTSSAIIAGATLGNSKNAQADLPSDEDAILTIIGEVGPYGKEGMQWVASTLRNRNNGVKGAYGMNNPNVVNKLYTKKQYEEAKQAWEESKKRDFTGGASNWFSDKDLKMPKVQKIIKEDKLVFIKRVGKNNFYKKSKKYEYTSKGFQKKES